jgi:hypothetical protein
MKKSLFLLAVSLLSLVSCTSGSKSDPYEASEKTALSSFASEIHSYYNTIHTYTIPTTTMHEAYGVDFTEQDSTTLDYAFFMEAKTKQFIGEDKYYYTYVVSTSGQVAEAFYGLDEDRKATGNKDAYDFYFSYMGKANIDIPTSLTVTYFESYFPNNSASA